ncbi:MAG: DUF2723 domain-containing protein [Pseudomonadota bacterium]
MDESRRVNWYKDPWLFTVVLASLLVYLLSMPTTVALEDDSLFILSGYFNGVSHPPGYPLHTLIVNFFTSIPLGSIPARAHASSAFLAAMSCGVLYCIACQFGLIRLVAAIFALAFSVSATFWSQAIITEVYSLNVFLNLCILLQALKIRMGFDPAVARSGVAQSDLCWFSLFAGLALINHWPLTVLALPGYLLLIAKPVFRSGWRLALILPGLLAVIAGYGYLYLNSQSAPPISFSGGFSNLGEFVDYLLRRHYQSVDVSASVAWTDKLLFSRDLVMQLLRELNLLLLFAFLGGWRLLSHSGSRVVGLALIWVALSNSFLLVAMLDFDYGLLYSNVFRVYPLTAIAAMFLLGAYEIGHRCSDTSQPLSGNRLVLPLAVVLVLNVYFSLPQNDRSDYTWGEEYATRILEDVPVGGVIFSDGEVELGLLSYYHRVEKRRPDITLYSSSALLLDNRLFDYRLEDKKAFLEKYVDDNPQRQFYAANNYYDLNTISRTLFVDRIGKGAETNTSVTFEDIDLLLKWSEQLNQDPWTGIALANLRKHAIAVLTASMKNEDPGQLKTFLLSKIDALVQSDSDLLKFMMSLIKDEDEFDVLNLRALMQAIESRDLVSKQDHSHYVYLGERLRLAQQPGGGIEEARRTACLNWQSVDNLHCQGFFTRGVE